jgi:hypothetical protein
MKQVPRHPSRQRLDKFCEAKFLWYDASHTNFVRHKALADVRRSSMVDASRNLSGREHSMMVVKILLVSLASFLVNIPLGIWRERTKKFSWQWFVAIHASIPFIIALRMGLRLHPVAIPINIAAAVVGQFVGGSLSRRNMEEKCR